MKTLDLNNWQSFGATTCNLEIRSFTASRLIAELPMGDYDDSPPFAWGDDYTLTVDGKTVLIGYVTRCKPRYTGTSYVWDLEISDYWSKLSNTPALDLVKAGDETYLTNRFIVARNADGSPADKVPMTIPISKVLHNILSNAAHLLPNGYQVRVSGPGSRADWMTVPFSASGDTPASLLQQCLDWQPNLVSYFDYADGGRLVITDNPDAHLIELDPLIHNFLSINIEPRPDLVPPVVAVIGLGVAGGYGAVVQAQYPQGVDVIQPYALTATIDIPSGTETNDDSDVPEPPPEQSSSGKYAPVMTVRGRKIDVDDSETMQAWWVRKFPSLSEKFGAKLTVGKSHLLPSTPDIDTEQNEGYSEEAEYELIEGLINGRTKTIKWGERVVESYITIQNPPSDLRAYFPNKAYEEGDVWQGIVRCRIRTTNVRRRSYLIDDDSTELDGDNDGGGGGDDDITGAPEPPPDIPGIDYDHLCYSLWTASQRLPYEGAATLTSDIDLNRLMGATLNIVNDRSDRATMRAIIQMIERDFITGSTTLTTGPPSHISIQDMINRQARIQGQQDRTNQDTAANDERGYRPAGGETWWNYDDPTSNNNKARSPGLGPWYALMSSAGQQALEADFSVRLVYDDDNNPVAAEIHQGRVVGPKGQFTAGNSDWNMMPVSSGSIYLNVNIGHDGEITSADFGTSPNDGDKAKPFVDARTGYTEQDFDVSTDFDGQTGQYSFLIATISGDKVTHHHLGVLSIPLLPFQLVYEVRDHDWDPDETGTPTPAPSGSNVPISLIHKNDNKYALLKKLQAGDGVTLTDDKGDIKISSTAMSHPWQVTVEKQERDGESHHIIKMNDGQLRDVKGDAIPVEYLSINNASISKEEVYTLLLEWNYTINGDQDSGRIVKRQGIVNPDIVVTPITTWNGQGKSNIVLATISRLTITQSVTTHLRAAWIFDYMVSGANTPSAAQEAEPAVQKRQ